MLTDRSIQFLVSLKLRGDVTIALYHGRSTLGGKVQGKLTSINICTVQFHTGLVESGTTTIKFPR